MLSTLNRSYHCHITLAMQAWMSTIADKLEVSLERFFISRGVGFGGAAAR